MTTTTQRMTMRPLAEALTWDSAKRRYRDTASGKLLTRAQAVALRDDLADSYAGRFRGLTRQYGQGDLSRRAWERGFRALITEASSAGYAFGRGGLALMTDADFDGLLRIVTTQLDFGDAFFTDVRSRIDSERQGKLVRDVKAALLPQIEARSTLYAGSVVNAYEQGSAAGVTDGGLGSLPAYPADGLTACRSACRCAWSITEQDGMWACRWITEGDERVCLDCRRRGREYRPLLVPIGAR